MKLTRNVDGHQFSVGMERVDSSVLLRCDTSDNRLRPLFKVIETAWIYDPIKLLRSVETRHGQSFEGEVAYAFSSDHPEEERTGVIADYLGDDVVVSELLFERVLTTVASTYLELCANLGVASPHMEAIERWLAERRAQTAVS